MRKKKIDQKLPNDFLELIVLDQNGKSIRMNTVLCRDRPTLIIFLRHFGCIGCSVQMAELTPRLTELEALGLKIVLIGNENSRIFRAL